VLDHEPEFFQQAMCRCPACCAVHRLHPASGVGQDCRFALKILFVRIFILARLSLDQAMKLSWLIFDFSI
jgi:hypothetical protein